MLEQAELSLRLVDLWTGLSISNFLFAFKKNPVVSMFICWKSREKKQLEIVQSRQIYLYIYMQYIQQLTCLNPFKEVPLLKSIGVWLES